MCQCVDVFFFLFKNVFMHVKSLDRQELLTLINIFLKKIVFRDVKSLDRQERVSVVVLLLCPDF